MLKKTGWFLASLLLSLLIMGIGIFIMALFVREPECTQQTANAVFLALRAVSLLAGAILLLSRLRRHGALNGFAFAFAAEVCRIILMCICGEMPFAPLWWADLLFYLLLGTGSGILIVNLFSIR